MFVDSWSAPSAICTRDVASVPFWMAWPIPSDWAWKTLAIVRPEASSAALLIRKPVDKRSNAVAQKSPCERNRVLMGKESVLKLGQRGPDARQEVPMRTPQRLYA